MQIPEFATYEAEALSKGFDAVLVRRWDPHAVIDEHAHPFDASAVVVEGEMWLTEAGKTRHLLPGDTFELPQGTLHSERYGVEGATYWVARRHGAAPSAGADR